MTKKLEAKIKKYLKTLEPQVLSEQNDDLEWHITQDVTDAVAKEFDLDPEQTENLANRLCVSIRLELE